MYFLNADFIHVTSSHRTETFQNTECTKRETEGLRGKEIIIVRRDT